MALVDCRPHGHTVCTFGNAKRQADEADRERAVAVIFGITVAVFIFLCVAGVVSWKICRKDPKAKNANNDIELAVLPEQPAFPQPVAYPGRPRSVSTAPPSYHTRSLNNSEQDLGVGGMENIDLKK